MEFSELEKRRIEKLVNAFLEKRRPPPDLRKKLDLGFRLEGQGLLLFEIRPVWKDPGRSMERPMAKATFTRLGKSGGFSGTGPMGNGMATRPVRRSTPSKNSFPW